MSEKPSNKKKSYISTPSKWYKITFKERISYIGPSIGLIIAIFSLVALFPETSVPFDITISIFIPIVLSMIAAIEARYPTRNKNFKFLIGFTCIWIGLLELFTGYSLFRVLFSFCIGAELIGFRIGPDKSFKVEIDNT